MLLNILLSSPSRRQLMLTLHDRLSTALNDAAVTERNLQRIDTERRFQENSLQVISKKLFSLQTIYQEYVDPAPVQNFLREEIRSLKWHLEDGPLISFDGTLKWRISGVEDKRRMYLKEELRETSV